MDIRVLFGLNMRRLRLAAGISQAALSVRVGVDRAHVSSMERGLQNVTLTTLWAVAQALEASPAALLDDGVANAAKPSAKAVRGQRTRPRE